MEKMHGLDLFSGIGGITLALSEWVQPIAYCEIDAYARGVLLSRMSEGKLPQAPIWDDIRTLTGDMLPQVDIIYGGFPCQDISIAGRGVGLEGEQSGLFFEIVRLAKEIKPKFLFLENVPAITTRGLDVVGEALAEVGYDLRWDTISAREVGAEFEGYRWFALAKARSTRLEGVLESSRSVYLQQASQSLFGVGSDTRVGSSNPDILRKPNGIPHAMDRVKCLGNAVVPLQVKTAFSRLITGTYK